MPLQSVQCCEYINDNRGYACDVTDYVILPLEGKDELTILTIMVLTCCVVGCHRRGGQGKVSFFPSDTDPRVAGRTWSYFPCAGYCG